MSLSQQLGIDHLDDMFKEIRPSSNKTIH